MQKYFSPNEERFFGEDDSATIQSAIEAACKDGCRKIVIPRYNARTDSTEWRIPVAIKIPSDFTVILDNCYIVQETGVYENMFCNEHCWDDSTYTAEQEDKNIKLIGEGNVVLDGGVHNRLLEKTTRNFGLPSMYSNNMLLWVNVNGLEVRNLHIQHQRWWAINHVMCRNVKIRDINLYAIPHVRNMDGIDLRIGCHDFDIENITGRTGDDVIAMTALMGRGEKERLVEGKETHIHHVNIRNVKADPATCFVVRVLNHDGNKIFDINMDTLMDVSDYATKFRPNCAVGIGSHIYWSIHPAEDGDTTRIHVKNVTTRATDTLLIWRTLTDSTFENIKTFGNNANGIRFVNGDFRNVTIDGFWDNMVQQNMFSRHPNTIETYTGAALDTEKATGDITVKNFHINKIGHVFKLRGELAVDAQNIDGGEHRVYADVAEGCKLTVDGKEVK